MDEVLRIPARRPVYVEAFKEEYDGQTGWTLYVTGGEVFLADAEADKLARAILFEETEAPDDDA